MNGLTLVAEVGGMAGLLLGVSFYHVAKFAAFLLDLKMEKLRNSK